MKLKPRSEGDVVDGVHSGTPEKECFFLVVCTLTPLGIGFSSNAGKLPYCCDNTTTGNHGDHVNDMCTGMYKS